MSGNDFSKRDGRRFTPPSSGWASRHPIFSKTARRLPRRHTPPGSLQTATMTMTTDTEAVIDARGLTKSYGAHRALNGVSFKVGAGRIVGLIGPNGAGKTTALKAVLGLTAFDGDLQVLGWDPR